MAETPTHDVMIGYLHGNTCSNSFVKSKENLFRYDLVNDHRILNDADVKCSALGIPDGRNKLAQLLLESKCKWLFMVDDDMGFEPYTLDALLAFADEKERPIVGGLAFAQRESIEDTMNGFRCFPTPTILDWVKHEDGVHRFTGRTHYPVNSMVQCGATGAAMLLVHRSVIKLVANNMGPTWFDPIRDPNGSTMGEDVSFFVRTQSLKIPLWVHTGIRTTHHKQLWLGESDFWTSFLAPPATETVDVIIPALHRPQNVQPLMESLKASTGLATAWFVCEEDDQEEIAAVQANGGRVLFGGHTFPEKVNSAYKVTAAPWLMLCGDDVRFRPGWLDQALDVARRYDGKVIATNDLSNPRVTRGEHATHPLISRSYIDQEGASWDGPGVVCHEGYSHWFCDDEWTEVAKQRGVFQAALGSQVEHMHPLFGKGEDDEVYQLGQKNSKEDELRFKGRLDRFGRSAA